jgi:hypothetical protein
MNFEHLYNTDMLEERDIFETSQKKKFVNWFHVLECSSLMIASAEFNFMKYSHSKAMAVFYKIVKLVKNGVLMIIPNHPYLCKSLY